MSRTPEELSREELLCIVKVVHHEMYLEKQFGTDEREHLVLTPFKNIYGPCLVDAIDRTMSRFDLSPT